MAQEIVTWCDTHMSKGERVVGQTWRLAVAEPGSKPREFELDACESCAEPFAALIADLQESARQVGGSKTTPTMLSAGASGAPLSPITGQPGMPCPLCAAVPASRNALDTHMRKDHDTSLAEHEGTAKYPCPVPSCDRLLLKPQGIMQHVKRSHADWFAENPDYSAAGTVPLAS